MTLPHFFDLLGVAVFAISGALAAGRKSLDLIGVLVIAIVTAVGGGTLRDLLLSRHPVFWVASPDFLSVSIVCALLTLVYVRWLHPPERLLLVADALGLALFTISGARIAQTMHVDEIIVVVMGVITGVFGGVLRDVLCAEIPMILRKGSIYATTAIAGASVFVLIDDLGLHRMSAAIIGMIVIAALRLGAIVWNWSLPVFSLAERPQK